MPCSYLILAKTLPETYNNMMENDMERMPSMPESQDMMSRLNQSGHKLSKSHRRIADYIAAHCDEAVFMTAARLADQVGVSESTVVRFATAMGYEGYPQLQRSLQELVSHRLTANERFRRTSDIDPHSVLSTVLKADMQNLHATLEELDPDVFDAVVERLLSAKAIYIMGLRSAAPLAQFLGYYLHFIFEDVRLVSNGDTDVFESISNVRSDDVLIGISFPRYSTRTLDAMRFARDRDAQVVAITDGPMSPLCEVADACLTARTDMSSFVDSMAAPFSVINALLVALGLHRKDALGEHLRQLENIWATYRVYLEEERHG